MLSFAQQRLWFLDQLQPGDTSENIHMAVCLTGLLDIQALERTLNEVVRRHEVLRTTFAERDGQPVQIISPPQPFSLPLIDLCPLPAEERQQKAQQLATAEAVRPFDLSRGPLLRLNLLRLDATEHVLLTTMHHIISDGWSLGVVMREIEALYEAYRSGEESPLAELPLQYADYAMWQRQWFNAEMLDEQLGYWKRQLAGAPAVLDLPTDRKRYGVRSHRGATQALILSSDLGSSLKALCREEGVTLFMLLLAAFQVLLARHSGQEDVVVGTPIAGRTQKETESLIGFFINTLALRTDLSGDPSFLQLLGRVREMCLGAYAHQDVPFERLIEELQPERSLDRHPLFEILFNNVNVPMETMKLADLTLSQMDQGEPEAKFAVTVYGDETGGKIRLRMLYQTDLFAAERIASVLDQFEYLLEQIVQDPQKKIHSYSLVTPASRRVLPDPCVQLLEPEYQPVPGMFADWAARAPQRVALRQGEYTWTYGELYERAASLAQSLLTEGLEPGEVVAVAGPRSLGLIASLLSVLMSRGVLLALDPDLPAQRRQLMLREAGVKRLLYVGERRAEDAWLDEASSLKISNVNADGSESAGPKGVTGLAGRREFDIAPDDAAYIFFTSGTTGVPKGVLGRHKGLSHFLTWQRETFAVGPHDRCAQLTNLSFDVVLRDIFLPLTSGATLCLPEEPFDVTAGHILRWMERENISLLHTVPSLAQSWLAQAPAEISLRHLRRVFFAGEPLTDTLVRRWRETFPEAGEIINLYGPTETTLAKCWYKVPAAVSPGVQPVGNPLPETQALVLNDEGQLCGIGERGQIVIRTPFRTLGYINADEEQQQRFVTNHFRQDALDVLYHTGDLGRYRGDGSLEILGRRDNQVKIRGVRIELGEIEQTLCKHSDVREAVVIARESQPGQKSLAAYVVAEPQSTPSVAQLRSHLRTLLPENMIPAAFVLLEALPLTPNGKVDRRALPEPDSAAVESATNFVAPRTPIEEMLAEIWSQVLEVERVGVFHNFFELGGHSLLAMQVISRIRETFQVALPLRLLFEEPTVEGLAKAVESTLIETTSAEDVAVALKELDELSDEELEALLAAQ